MKVIGITGGIGAGKSVVSRILRCKGLPVYDCDFEARRIMDDSAEVKSAIGSRLGAHCLNADGSLNRPAIAGEVFSDSEKLQWLNALVHTLVREDFLYETRRLSREGYDTFFVESAILRSSGLDRLCDEIWLVESPMTLRLERAMTRDNCERERILERIAAQQSEFDGLEAEKLRVIENDGIRPLLAQVDKLLRQS